MKLLSYAMIFVMLINNCFIGTEIGSDDFTSKTNISKLEGFELDDLNEGEAYTVRVWIKDIDHSDIRVNIPF